MQKKLKFTAENTGGVMIEKKGKEIEKLKMINLDKYTKWNNESYRLFLDYNFGEELVGKINEIIDLLNKKS